MANPARERVKFDGFNIDGRFPNRQTAKLNWLQIFPVIRYTRQATKSAIDS